ncbi:cation channel family protein (macronuclear) [Tetrahymena thermophila SB210]|uniref:Cation channel family protein n=1 Tax=Tetrahymena thermophila (strain SB210) TaxID=312017 RepID=Q237N2_TETTS|nr:cation channel family protein [Tetrahymena thermophila SB210]EAR92709.2 cation channel family protein [Tetrahymena thermophila SB210]|eukprot:XP_001012954.2 cation channel family protein [Tetrahymena thermophila SB210]
MSKQLIGQKNLQNGQKSQILQKAIFEASLEEKIKIFQKYNLDLLNNDYIDKKNQQRNNIFLFRTVDIVWRVLDYFPVFNPYNKCVIAWDVLQILAVFNLLFIYPLIFVIEAAFNNRYEYFCSIIVLIDMIIRLNIGFFDMDTFIICKKKIFQHYLKHGLPFDILGNVSIVYYLFFPQHDQPLLLLILSKLYMIRKLLINVEETYFHNFQLRNYMKLLKLICTLIFFAHLFACGWIYVGNLGFPNNWIQKAGLQNDNWQSVYLKSIYYALVTMITVGYGDITPQNYSETIFVSFIMVLACGIFGYSLNQIGTIFNDIFKYQEQLRENIAIISIYMKKKKISTPLQFKIRQYLQFYWKENKEEEQQKQLEIKQILSQQLQSELVWDENKLILREARILVDNFSEEVMRKTASIIRHINYTPEEIIFQEGDSDNKNLYFVEKGSCEIFIEGNDKKQTLYEIQSGQYFGTTSFFTGLNRTCSIRSQGFSTLLFINRDDFIDICKQSAPDFEKFCYLRDKVLYENDFSFINSQCYCCHQSHHQLHECQFLHFNNKTNFLNKLTESEKLTQLKRQNVQNNKNKTPTLIKLCTTQKLHKLFMRENQSQLYEYEQNNFLQIIADMYNSEDYEEDDSMILLNEESPVFTVTNIANDEVNTIKSNQRRNNFDQEESSKYFQKSFSLNQNQQLQHQNKFQQMNQQEYQKSQSYNIQSDDHVSKNNINVNFFTAAEPNYMQTQSTDRGRFESFLSNKFRQGEDGLAQKRVSFNEEIVDQKRVSSYEATIDQKSMPIISTILAINNSNITNNNQAYSLTKVVKSNMQPSESNYADRSSITLSKIEVRSRNNSALSNVSCQSPLTKKSQLFFNKISNNFIEQNLEQEVNNKQLEQNSFIHQEERQYNLDQNELQFQQSLSSIVSKNQKDKLVKESSQSSSQIQKLLPSKQSSQIYATQSKSSGTNVLTTLLKVKNITKKIKNKFENAKKNLQELQNQQSSNDKSAKYSELKTFVSEKKQNQNYGINFELISQHSQMFFFLMKHRNIVTYSTTQQILDEQFEKMQDYTHYYPLGNSQIVTKLLSLSQKDRVKHYKRILELSKIEYKNDNSRNVNSISRLKNKFQKEQNSVNTFNKFNNYDVDDSKSQTFQEIFKDIDGDSYSKILNQNNHNLKQHFSQIVNQNPKRRKTTATNKIDQSSQDVEMPTPKLQSQINSINQMSINLGSPIFNYNQKRQSQGSPFVFSKQIALNQIPQTNQAYINTGLIEKPQLTTKTKYQITTIKEVDQQINDMDNDINSNSIIPDPQNSFNITIPNLQVNNQQFKEYLDDL